MQAQGLVSPIIQYGASKDEKAQLACVALSDKQGLFCCNTEELCIRPHHHYSPCNNGKRTKGLDTLSGCIWFVFLCLCMISACTCLFLCVVLTASMDKKIFVLPHMREGIHIRSNWNNDNISEQRKSLRRCQSNGGKGQFLSPRAWFAFCQTWERGNWMEGTTESTWWGGVIHSERREWEKCENS